MLATRRSEVAGKINDKVSFGGGGGDESNGSRRGESQDEREVCAEMKKGLQKQSHRILRFIHHSTTTTTQEQRAQLCLDSHQ